MARRLFDITIAATALFLIAPIMLAAAIGIRLSSPGPVFYKANRVGRNRQLFTMYKLRTMHCRTVAGSSITASNDPRVFTVGRILRALKIDELPQLVNVLKGDMAIIGPRPEAPDIVEKYYTPDYLRSLAVKPGLSSPGSICYYTHGEQLLADGEAEEFYVTRLLPVKMAIDLEYQDRATMVGDLGIIFRTALTLAQKAMGRKDFPEPPQLAQLRNKDAERGSVHTDPSRTDSAPDLRRAA
ncbi:MAG: sugar transferase [Planctomycetaceae bacterium]|nr:sugar transferase [Planctomycetaceae bacterium]